MAHRGLILGCGIGLVGALMVMGPGCGDSFPQTCSLVAAPLGSNALTLLPDARLDRVGGGFVLLGTDGNSVMWQTIDIKGTAGPLRTVAVPSHTDGPWFGVAGTSAGSGDHVVIVYATNPSGGKATLTSITAGIDGSAGAGPSSIGMIPDRGAMKAALLVSAGSGQGGQHMGLMWSVKGTSTVTAKILGPDGQPLGDDVSLGSVDDIDCPRFMAGQGDLTATFVKTSGMPPTQTLVAREFNADGTSGSTLNLQLTDWSADEGGGCVALAAASPGYSIGWRVNSSSFSGDDYALFDPSAGGVYTPYPLLSDERATTGHAPPVAGMGKTSDKTTRFIVALAQTSGVQAWEIDFQGHQIAPALTLPSVKGNTGPVQTQTIGGSLYLTYADYTSKSTTTNAAGNRIFGHVTCE